MPKNKGKGGKNRRRGKNVNEILRRELVVKEASQEYAQVQKMLGNGRLTAFCFDGKTRLCHIRGKMRKKIWVNHGDIILVGLREYQDNKADVMLKYTPDEARFLKNNGHLPQTTEINELGENQINSDVQFVDNEDGAFDTESDIGVQNRNYEISSDEETEDESDSDEDATGNANESVNKVAPSKKAELGPSAVSLSDSEEEDESEKEEEDPKLLAERGNYYKPGARDHLKKKGKRGK